MGRLCRPFDWYARYVATSCSTLKGKMQAAGTAETWTEDSLEALGKLFVEARGDVVLFPAPVTVPGADRPMLHKAVHRVHQSGGLVMCAVATSQEGANTETVRQIALEQDGRSGTCFTLVMLGTWA